MPRLIDGVVGEGVVHKVVEALEVRRGRKARQVFKLEIL